MPTPTVTIALHSRTDVIFLARSLDNLMRNAGYTKVDRAKLCTAASELAQNALYYGGGGVAEISVSGLSEPTVVTVMISDSGPGIADLDLAMTPGYSSGGTMGLGLSGARNLVDNFKISTSQGQGTRVTIVKSKLE